MMHQNIPPAHVIGPSGEPLTLDGLPPPSTKRWLARHKAAIVAAVDGGLLTLDEACAKYRLSVHEYVAWQRALDRAGLAGLRATKSQYYRNEWERKAARETGTSGPRDDACR